MTRTGRRPIETMSATQIAALLECDGYYDLLGREAEIKLASERGALLWTRDHLKTTDTSDIDALPER